jgi:hypothetical protein
MADMSYSTLQLMAVLPTAIRPPRTLDFKDAHLPPPLSQLRNTLSHPLRSHQTLHEKQIKFFPESQKVSKETIKVRFDGQV